MTTGKPRDGRKEQFWRRRIREWQSSGLSIGVFCARHGLSQPRFYAWRRELRRRDLQKPLFVPIHVQTEDQAAPVEQALEVLLSGGRRVRVVRGFDATTLRQLLAVLEEGASC